MKIIEHLAQTGIDIAPSELAFAKGQLQKIIRARNLIPQPGRKRENVWVHTGEILDMNKAAFRQYPELQRTLDYSSTTIMGGMHDMPEGLTPHGDLNYADTQDNGYDIRRGKELAEYSVAHHYVEHIFPSRPARLKIHRVVDNWFLQDSLGALWVRVLDMVAGNQSVLQIAMNSTKGPIQKIDNNGDPIIWSSHEAGAHVSKMAAEKTLPVVETLVHKLPTKAASLSVLHWFSSGMMQTYHDTGWGSLPVIQEYQRRIDTDLRGFEL